MISALLFLLTQAVTWGPPVLHDSMLLADRGVVQGNIGHPPFPPKQVARLAVYVEGLVNGLPCII